MEKISEIEVQVAGRRMPLRRVQLICPEPSLTKQHFVKDADIRTILARYAKTGILGDPTRKPIFGDFSQTDYEVSLNAVAHVKSNFELLAAPLRGRFNNDPAQLLAFIADPANKEEAIKLGLKKPDPEVPPVTPPPAV